MLQPDEPLVDERGRPVPDGLDGARESFAVERGGITLGQVVWLPRTEEQRALLPSVAAAAGLAIEMARLRVELPSSTARWPRSPRPSTSSESSPTDFAPRRCRPVSDPPCANW
jgi:hypothetical protein